MPLAEELGISLDARGELIEYGQVREWADPSEEELSTLIERINTEWIKPYGLTEDDLVQASGLKRPYVCYLLSDLARPLSPTLGGSANQGRVEVYSVLLEMLRRFDEGQLKEVDFLRIKANHPPEAAVLVKTAPATMPLNPRVTLDSARESLGVSAIAPPATVPLSVDLLKMADQYDVGSYDAGYTPSHHDPTVTIDASPSAATAIAEKDSQGDFDGDENTTDGGMSPPPRSGPPATSPIYNSNISFPSVHPSGVRGPSTMPVSMTIAPPTFPMPPAQSSFPSMQQHQTDSVDTSPFILPPLTVGVGIGANGSIIPGPQSVPLQQPVPLLPRQLEIRPPPATTPLHYHPQTTQADVLSTSTPTPVRTPPPSVPLMAAGSAPQWSSVPLGQSPPHSIPIRPSAPPMSLPLAPAPQSMPIIPSAPLSSYPTTVVEPPTVQFAPPTMSFPSMGQLPYPSLTHTVVAPPSVPLTAMSPSLIGGPLAPRPMSTPISMSHGHNMPLSALAAHLYGNQTGPPRPSGLAPVVEPPVEEASESETQTTQRDGLQEGEELSGSDRKNSCEDEVKRDESESESHSNGGEATEEQQQEEEDADSGKRLEHTSQDQYASGGEYAHRQRSSAPSRRGTEQSSTLYQHSERVYATGPPHLESTPMSSRGPQHFPLGGSIGSLPLSQLEINYHPNENSTSGRLPLIPAASQHLSVANSFVTEVTPEATQHPEDSGSERSEDQSEPPHERRQSKIPDGSNPMTLPSSSEHQLPPPQWNDITPEVVVSLDTPHTTSKAGHFPHHSGGSIPSDLVSGLLPGFERHTEEDEESAAELVRACLYNTESQRRRTEQAVAGESGDSTTGPRGRAALERFLEDKFINKAVRVQLEKASGLLLKRQHRRLQKAKERGDTSQEIERTIDLLVIHMEITSRSVPGDIKATDASSVASLMKEVHLLIAHPRRECSAEAECLAWTLLVEALRHT